MTASVMVLAEVASASRLSFCSNAGADLLRGVIAASIPTDQSVPMCRLTERMVRSTLVTAIDIDG